DEITHLSLYLDIEKVRFDHRLTTTFHIEEQAKQAKVPSLIIQPLLENAIKFGLYNVIGEVEITVNIRLENFLLYIVTTNPFDTDQFDGRTGTGCGLSSIQRRLCL